MPQSSCYLAVFDLSRDRERVKVAKCLEGFGIRVQKSVFECRLTRGGRERLLHALRKLNPDSGNVYLYRLGAGFRRDEIGRPGKESRLSDENHAFVVT